MKVSVIIPAYNEEKYIGKTIESVSKQTHKDVEIIVVCNGCTDNTSELCNKYDVKILNLNERNVSKARNEGTKIASGKFLIFLDADTIISDEVIENIYNLLKGGDFFGTCKGKAGDKNINSFLYVNTKNLLNNYFMWSNGLIFCNRNSFSNIGGFNEELKTKGEVKDILRRLRKVSKYKCVNSSFVVTSQRRINKWGLIGSVIYWIKESIKHGKGEYEEVR